VSREVIRHEIVRSNNQGFRLLFLLLLERFRRRLHEQDKLPGKSQDRFDMISLQIRTSIQLLHVQLIPKLLDCCIPFLNLTAEIQNHLLVVFLRGRLIVVVLLFLKNFPPVLQIHNWGIHRLVIHGILHTFESFIIHSTVGFLRRRDMQPARRARRSSRDDANQQEKKRHKGYLHFPFSRCLTCGTVCRLNFACSYSTCCYNSLHLFLVQDETWRDT
jgi:hypothetical protein